MTDSQITDACRRYGAAAVHRAAFDALRGQRAGLQAMGLPAGLADANRIMSVAFNLLSPEDRAADLADAVLGLARLPPASGPPQLEGVDIDD